MWNNLDLINLWGNSLADWMWFLGLFVVITLTLFLLKKWVFSWLDENIVKKYKKKNKSIYALTHTILSIPSHILVVISAYVSLQFVYINENISYRLSVVFTILIIFWAAGIFTKFVTVFLEKIFENNEDKSLDMAHDIIRIIVKVSIWIIAILLIMINIGIEITPLVASLGIGGIAIAFALQNVLQDIFASFSIFLEKPFVIGDFIIVGDTMGTVDHITFKSTYISALGGQFVIIPNRDMMNSRIENFRMMKKRWIRQRISVLYETDIKKLEKIPEMIKEELDKIDSVSLTRAHIRELSAYSIDIEFAYHVETKDFSVFVDNNQTIILALLRRFKKEGIEFAYPTQMIHTKSKI